MLCAALSGLFHLILFSTVLLRPIHVFAWFCSSCLDCYVISHCLRDCPSFFVPFCSTHGPLGCVRSNRNSGCCCDLLARLPCSLGTVTRSRVGRLRSVWPEADNAKRLFWAAAPRPTPPAVWQRHADSRIHILSHICQRQVFVGTFLGSKSGGILDL